MKVVICGAGQVGYNIARVLAREAIDVTVIDKSEETVRRVGDALDVQAMIGFASHPDALERAGVADADLLIAVTHSDEVNMMACQVASALFDVPTKIARIRSQSYLDPIYADLFTSDHLPIDVVISPEVEVARAIVRDLRVPGAFDIVPLADGRMTAVGVHCHPDCPIADTPLRQLTDLFPDLSITVIAIIRGGRAEAAGGDDEIRAGDDVYFVADSRQVGRALLAFGHDESEARRLVIVGGGNVGLFLAQEIERDFPHVTARLVEYSQERAGEVARALRRTLVIRGDGLDSDILLEAGAASAETVVAVTNDDETNILSSLLCKRAGTARAMTLVNKSVYAPLISSLGVDTVINPHATTVSTILQHVRRGRIKGVHALSGGIGEIIEGEALATSPLVGRPLRDLALPEGAVIGGVVRGEEILTPRGDTAIRAGDRFVVFAVPDTVKKIERMFAPRLEYF